MTTYKTIAAWTWFCLAQLLMLVLTIVGWLLLIPACLLRAWEPSPYPSINDGRRIDRWRWPINAIYGNPEDGVSGRQAMVWLNTSTRGPFMPGAYPPWRAWVWSAWRNSADSLKYSLALWIHGPHMTCRILGRTLSAGWSIENLRPVLVLSWKA